MAFSALGNRGIVSEVNVVPLIDILLVLLVIFLMMPHKQLGLQADLPQQKTESRDPEPSPEALIVTVLDDGSLRINQSAVLRDDLRDRLERLLAPRLHRVAYLQAGRSLEFETVARVLDLMHSAGASPVGLLTSELEKSR